MKVKCSSCGSTTSIADDKVRGRRVKVRCKSCGTRLVVDATQGGATTAAASDVKQSAPPPASGSGGPGAPPPAKPAASLPPAGQSAPAAKPAPSMAPARTTLPGPSKVAPANRPAPAAGRPSGAVRLPPATGKPAAATARSAPPPPTKLSATQPPPPKAKPQDKSQPQTQWWVNLDESDEQSMTVPQIVEGWKAGTITDDAYVWRDGMEDWLPVLEVSELKAAIDGAKAGPGVRLPPPAGGAVAAASSAAGGAGEVFIDAEPIEPLPPSETSTQISLQALKAGMKPAAAQQGNGRPKQKSVQDLMGFGSATATPSPLLALGTADLATAPAPPPPPEPKVVSVAPSAAPPATKSAFRAVAFIIGVFFAMVAGGLVVAMLVRSQAPAEGAQESGKKASGDEKAAGSKDSESKASAGKDGDEKSVQKEEKKASKDEPEEASTEKTTEKGPAKVALAPPTTRAKKDERTPDKKKDEPAATKDTPSKLLPQAEEEPAPKTGNAPPASFDKRAAIAALQTAASASTACRRLDGPTGAGRATVTFAPSGRVTNVQISGGSFGGTSVGSCVAGVFRRAKIPSFTGSSVTVAKGFTIPK